MCSTRFITILIATSCTCGLKRIVFELTFFEKKIHIQWIIKKIIYAKLEKINGCSFHNTIALEECYFTIGLKTISCNKKPCRIAPFKFEVLNCG